ncbi:hypothetical protein CEXT_633001 [Caerostris extrusa]|uniref:Uncharacterized protein n=1 Tax=Caerostris extrusa TaxID=172846 RepID=A0AAV4N146_CAEEX|nr:hypothetical protein CEXT_633001 [Caerostris extrusa]
MVEGLRSPQSKFNYLMPLQFGEYISMIPFYQGCIAGACNTAVTLGICNLKLRSLILRTEMFFDNIMVEGLRSPQSKFNYLMPLQFGEYIRQNPTASRGLRLRKGTPTKKSNARNPN